MIYDLDDDNILRCGDSNASSGCDQLTALPHTDELRCDQVDSRYATHGAPAANYSVWNPVYDYFAPTRPGMWPRGFPLSLVRLSMTKTAVFPKRELVSNVAVWQSLADHDPDVDAIFRLARPLPLAFSSRKEPIALPAKVFAPLNAQTTLHLYKSL